MRIALINGSPKVKNSSSSILLEDLKGYLGKNVEVVNVELHSPAISKEDIEELMKTDAWVFSYPLYVDGIPGHLLSCLIQLEEACVKKSKKHIYGIVNCGFYEGIQAEIALKILQNWCLKTGYIWSGGIGVGGGGGLAMISNMKPGQGPKAAIDRSIEKLALSILKNDITENHYVSIAFPRFLYKMGAQLGWRQMMKANGGKAKDLGKKLD